jgi:hypothetical protein
VEKRKELSTNNKPPKTATNSFGGNKHPYQQSKMSSTILTQSTPKVQRIIDLTDSIPDITANIIHNSEHHQLPSDIFENLIFEALNDLIDDFSLDPDKYLKTHHETHINRIAEQYLNS